MDPDQAVAEALAEAERSGRASAAQRWGNLVLEVEGEQKWAGRSCCDAPRPHYSYRCLWAAGKAGGCSQPIAHYCLECGKQDFAKCKSTSATQCRVCGSIYQGNVRSVVEQGMVRLLDGGPIGMRLDAGWTFTLTAPGEVPHCGKSGHVRSGKPCRFGSSAPDCELCRCTPRSDQPFDVARWNSRAGKHFSYFIQALRRGEASGRRRRHQDLVYIKVTEVQERGALHFHVAIFSPDGELYLSKKWLRELAMDHFFGHSIDLQRIKPGVGKGTVGAIPSYFAKYVSKAVDQRLEVPWLLLNGQRASKAAYRSWSSSWSWPVRMAEVRFGRRLRSAGPGGAEGAEGAEGSSGLRLDASTNCSTINRATEAEGIDLGEWLTLQGVEIGRDPPVELGVVSEEISVVPLPGMVAPMRGWWSTWS